jgi:hypothetical protein
MHLNGWIGLGKQAREKHVFTLQAMKLSRLESRETKASRHLRWPAHPGVWNNSGKRFTGNT